MSSGKAPATPQKPITTPATQPTQQQPPKAPLSYRRAVNQTAPALPKLGSSWTSQNQAALTTTGLSAQASAFQLQPCGPPSMSTLSIADTHQPTTQSTISAHSASNFDSQSNSVPINLPANTTSTSASSQNAASTDKKSKDSKKPDKQQPPRLKFIDESHDIARQAPQNDSKGHFEPGVVVDDKAIRLPLHFDFWLQAHLPLQDTGRPCHYFVIENGIGFMPDQLQQVTFDLRWVYATSVTPVSVVGPAYYADKLCERGRCYLRPLLIGKHGHRPDKAVHDAWLQGLQGFGRSARQSPPRSQRVGNPSTLQCQSATIVFGTRQATRTLACRA